MDKVKVLVVDDSAVIRQVMTGLLSSDPGIEVLGAAADPLFALRRMEANWPDVIVLDVEMPRMDGITFLRKIMAERPTPVVMCSTFTEKGAETTVQALAAGAVEVITKPRLGAKLYFEEESAAIAQVIKSAAQVRMEQVSACVEAPRRRPEPVPAAAAGAMLRTTERVVAIGTSTGGTHALEAVLTMLPRTATGIVIVQHMPEKFTAAFADRLDRLCEIEVREAADGDRVMPGRALIAPGGKHMLLKRSGARYYVEVGEGPLVNRHRPSVDVLFRSVARVAGRNALGIIMTGMGDDGADGITEMHEAGARTLAQNEESCVVYGMPKEAVKRGGIDAQVSLDAIAGEIVRYGA